MDADDLLLNDGEAADGAPMVVLNPLPTPYNKRPRKPITIHPERPPVGGLWPHQLAAATPAAHKTKAVDARRGIEERELWGDYIGQLVEVCVGEKYATETPYETTVKSKTLKSVTYQRDDYVETLYRGTLCAPCWARVDENGVVWSHTGPVFLANADVYTLRLVSPGDAWRPSATGQAVEIPGDRIVVMRLPSPHDLRFWDYDQKRRRRGL